MVATIGFKTGVKASLMIKVIVGKIALKCMASNMVAGMILTARNIVDMSAAEIDINNF